ncbi:unnamed protein product [Arctogadus glacialis]
MAGATATAPAADSGPVGMLALMEPLAKLAWQPQPKPPSEDEIFFRALHPAMSRLSSPSGAMVRYEVYQIVSRADMEAL